MQKIRRKILLNPGPATTSDRIKLAQVVPDICHREREFGELLLHISTELTNMVTKQAGYRTILFGGSGTAAVESIISSVVDKDYILVINNGSYGKRMCQIAEAYSIKYIEYESPPDLEIDLLHLENFLKKIPHKISHLAVVHTETTTGLLNDIKLIGEMCKRHSIDMIVDAMSSFGAIPINMEHMNISYLAASSNKNMQGMPGVSFVIASQKKLDALEKIKPRNFYLNLFAQYKFFEENQLMRFTPPIQTLYALWEAIMELKAEGVEGRYKRYSKSWETLVDGITRLGLQHIVKEEHHSRIVTAIIEPEYNQYDFDQLHDFLYSHDYTIYPGKLDDQNTFRVAVMGDITYKEIESFLNLLERYLRQIGYINTKKQDDE